MPARGPFQAGETILLHDRAGHRYRVTLQGGAKQSLHTGTIPHDELIGQPAGSIVRTHRGSPLLALRPTFAELLVERERPQIQPIYPKDLGGILVHADVFPGARVLEAGTGTGALTMALARAVGPAGCVTSYEAREDSHEAAERSIRQVLGGLPQNVALKVGSVYGPIEEREMDRVLLDVPEPWEAVATSAAALLPGGVTMALCPNIDQSLRYCDALRQHGGFGLLDTFELLERHWVVGRQDVRPLRRMVAHTGFLTTARRLAGEEGFEARPEATSPR